MRNASLTSLILGLIFTGLDYWQKKTFAQNRQPSPGLLFIRSSTALRSFGISLRRSTSPGCRLRPV